MAKKEEMASEEVKEVKEVKSLDGKIEFIREGVTIRRNAEDAGKLELEGWVKK